ncbi:hypothetical protein L6164_001728 [Bauhinia variegata]|uniref:Uncharacterized protein n=1 Tax=Bauhinia variegata TaxID=167791 RepID=A0ACB9QBU4_BAUVA|nr:hypothetical protein L6164_001728 [Bauhinia variegata]
MNRTITKRIRCMLSHAKLPKAFWGEAMRTAVDLINLSPSIPLSGDIPERVWKGKDVSYKHLRVFGCRAFVHIPRDERFKLDGKSKQCIFLSYGNEEFGYKLWDPINKKIVRSRDVIFFEDQTIEDIEKEGKPKPIARNDSVYEPELPARDVNDGGDANINGENRENNFLPQADVNVPAEPVLLEPIPPINTELRRSVRQSHPSQKYPPHEYVLLTDGGEPESYEEALIPLSSFSALTSVSKMEEKEKGFKKKVMVVIDESDDSHYALIWVLENLKEVASNSSLTIFATQPFPDLNHGSAQLGLGRFSYPFVFSQDLITSMQKRIKKISLGLCEKAKSICAARGVNVEAFTEAGDPKEVICDQVYKHGTDLLVMANYPSSPFRSVFMESLSSYCSRNAKCPVLLVDKPAEP